MLLKRAQTLAMRNNESTQKRYAGTLCRQRERERTTGLMFNGSRVSKEMFHVQNRLPTESG